MAAPALALGRSKNRAGREHALMAAAGRLFAARGYEAATTREIAAEAGCAEGLIHRYFHGKAGLLLALIQHRGAEAADDLARQLRPAPALDQELLQLVEFELDRVWKERELFKVLVPRSIVDPSLGPLLSRLGPSRQASAIAARLRRCKQSASLPDEDVEALSQLVGVIAFMFGFVRPALMGDDREQTKAMAMRIARLVTQRL